MCTTDFGISKPRLKHRMATRYKGNYMLQVAQATLEALAPPAAQVCAQDLDDQVDNTVGQMLCK